MFFWNGTTEECSVNRLKGNRATGNLNIHRSESHWGHSLCYFLDRQPSWLQYAFSSFQLNFICVKSSAYDLNWWPMCTLQGCTGSRLCGSWLKLDLHDLLDTMKTTAQLQIIQYWSSLLYTVVRLHIKKQMG